MSNLEIKVEAQVQQALSALDQISKKMETMGTTFQQSSQESVNAMKALTAALVTKTAETSKSTTETDKNVDATRRSVKAGNEELTLTEKLSAARRADTKERRNFNFVLSETSTAAGVVSLALGQMGIISDSTNNQMKGMVKGAQDGFAAFSGLSFVLGAIPGGQVVAAATGIGIAIAEIANQAKATRQEIGKLYVELLKGYDSTALQKVHDDFSRMKKDIEDTAAVRAKSDLTKPPETKLSGQAADLAISANIWNIILGINKELTAEEQRRVDILQGAIGATEKEIEQKKKNEEAERLLSDERLLSNDILIRTNEELRLAKKLGEDASKPLEERLPALEQQKQKTAEVNSLLRTQYEIHNSIYNLTKQAYDVIGQNTIETLRQQGASELTIAQEVHRKKMDDIKAERENKELSPEYKGANETEQHAMMLKFTEEEKSAGIALDGVKTTLREKEKAATLTADTAMFQASFDALKNEEIAAAKTERERIALTDAYTEIDIENARTRALASIEENRLKEEAAVRANKSLSKPAKKQALAEITQRTTTETTNVNRTFDAQQVTRESKTTVSGLELDAKEEAKRIELHKASENAIAQFTFSSKENTLAKIDAKESELIDNMLNDETLTWEEKEKRFTEITQEAANQRADYEAKKTAETAKKIGGIMKQGLSVISAFSKQSSDARIDALETEKEDRLGAIDAELSAENLSAARKKELLAQRKAVEDDYNKKIKEEKTKAWEADRNAKLLESIINTAVAVAEALPNIPLAIIVGAMGAAQTALIAAQPTPKFHEGGVVGKNEKPGKEIPILAQAGEVIRTIKQERDLQNAISSLVVTPKGKLQETNINNLLAKKINSISMPQQQKVVEKPTIIKQDAPKQERNVYVTQNLHFNAPVGAGEKWIKEQVQNGLAKTGATVDKYFVNDKSLVKM